MDNIEAQTVTKDIFDKINRADSIADLEDILGYEKIKKNKMNPEKYPIKYPKINFGIKYDEISRLVDEKGYLLESNLEDNHLAKLLYALVWKQGDLLKVKNIVKGIQDEKDSESGSVVFHQFGKHLANRNEEPIIDQHVIRAFRVYKTDDKDKGEISNIRKTNILSAKKNAIHIEDYKKWLSGELQQSLKNENNYMYHIDQILFALGKTIKTGKANR